MRYGYNGAGRLETVTDPAGGVTRYTYDAQGRILSVTNPRGITYVTNQYDENHRHILNKPVRQWDSIPGGPKLSEVIYKYDEYGRIDNTLYDSDTLVMWDDPHFTVRGLPTTVKTWKAGSLYDLSRIYYDQCGNVIKTVNPKGDSSKVFYAPSGDPDKYQYTLPCSTES